MLTRNLKTTTSVVDQAGMHAERWSLPSVWI